ncbi:MAG: hypothetical protein WKF66_07880 [Pedobacter sp.]
MGFIIPGHMVSGPLEWSEYFKMNAKVGTHSMTHVNAGRGHINLSYNIGGEAQQHRIEITSRTSNLGNNALIWLFICPVTNKLCWKLFFNGQRFVHQSQIDGLYTCQTKSRKGRDLDKLLDFVFGNNDICAQLMQKHLKKTYRGKPTKKYSNLMRRKERVNHITHDDINRLIITGSL